MLALLVAAPGLVYLSVRQGWVKAPLLTPAATATPSPVPTKKPAPRATAVPKPTRPPNVPADFESAGAPSRGVIALLLDDLGYDGPALTRLATFKGPLAVAVLPDAPFAAEAAALAKRKGWDLLVHFPMDPVSGKPEPSSVGEKDDDQTIRARVGDAIGKVPGAIGLNNHQGSKATGESRVVRAVLTVVRDRGLFFLDSRTTAASVAEREARALGVSFLARDVFLDDAATEAQEGTREALDAAWARAREIAAKKGSCVVIGHPHKETLDFLSARLAELERQKIRRVKVSELVE